MKSDFDFKNKIEKKVKNKTILFFLFVIFTNLVTVGTSFFPTFTREETAAALTFSSSSPTIAIREAKTGTEPSTL